jgi:hypothetical protein
MKTLYYTYNNEAIASCVFLAVLEKLKTMDITRSCLILPFLLDDRTVKYLSENQNNEITLEQIKNDKPLLFASFNKRYQSLLPITINALMILNKSNQINIGKEIAIINTLPIHNAVMGERLNRIISVIPTFLFVIGNHSTTKLYELLKIQL